jgi:hypothetical protein
VTTPIHIDVQLLVSDLVKQLVSLIKMIVVFRSRTRLKHMFCDLVADLAELHEKVRGHEIKKTIISEIDLRNLKRLQICLKSFLNFCQFLLQVLRTSTLKVLASTVQPSILDCIVLHRASVLPCFRQIIWNAIEMQLSIDVNTNAL